MTPTPEKSNDQCSVCGHVLMVASSSPGNDAPCPHCGQLVWFRKQEMDDFVILNLLPGMDPEHADFERIGEWLVRSDNPPNVVVNFANVEFVSSTFLGHLMVLQKKLNRAERKVTLSGLNEVVRQLFQITKLESMFEFSDE
jgi:anti-sigma B factor antagonist